MSEARKATVRQVFERIDRQDFEVYREAYALGYVLHVDGIPEPLDHHAHEELARSFYRTFPDLIHTIEDQIAEGDRVATRTTVRGTHLGEFRGVVPTGKQVTCSVFAIRHFDGDRIVEQWVQFDATGLMRQLGSSDEVSR